MKKTRAAETREQLLARRAELRQRLGAIKRDYAGGLDRDLGEQAIQLENAEVLAELSREAAAELQAIENKLRRLENSGERR
jgi:RNA polymerase-binding transcription factor DksA